MKQILTLITCLLFTGLAYGQHSILRKSTYENIKYDKYHGWDTLTPAKEEIIVLNEYRTSLQAKLYQLRKYNKTRCYYDTLPDEVQELAYVKALKHKDGTVPVFKLIIDDLETQVNNRKKSNVEIVKQLMITNIADTSDLPNEFSNYIENQADVMVTASQYYEDPYETLDTLGFCSNEWFKYFKEYKCFTASDFGKHKNMIFRFFVKSDGSVTYVDAINNIGCSQLSDCYKQVQEWALLVVNNYDFKPALKNGKPVNSYTNVVVCMNIGDCGKKTNKTRRK